MFNAYSTRTERRQTGSFGFPRANVNNITCLACKQHFCLKAFCPLKGSIPVVLSCGHVICNSCSKRASQRRCPLCNLEPENITDIRSELPLNIYALGLMMLSYNRPVHQADDSDISFQQPYNVKNHQHFSEGQCSECGIQAEFRCIQCNVLFCISCYSKIHGRALQGHTKILLSDEKGDDGVRMRTTCTERCNEPLGYYCTDCKTSSCSKCLARLHPKHNFVDLKEKNDEHWSEFEDACADVTESIMRIEQVQKKIKSMMASPPQSWNVQSEEKEIGQHFARLHGILQNMQEGLIDKLFERRNNLVKNLEELYEQLKKDHNMLQSALKTAASAKDNVERVDLLEVIQNLQKIADVACHLKQEPTLADQKIEFNVDPTIFEKLENHFHIEVPPLCGFSLVPRSLLPEDYAIEPLVQHPLAPRSIGRPISSQRSNVADAIVPAKPIECTLPAEGTSEMIHITHVVDPFCFYAQQVSCKSKIEKLEKELAETSKFSVLPSTVVINKMYLVQSTKTKMWCRGRVTALKEDKSECDLMLVDYGMTEVNVPISELRSISIQYSTLPVMVMKCALSDIVPRTGQWNQDSIDNFIKIIKTSRTISMFVTSICGDTYYVDLALTRPHHRDTAAEMLINLKFANRLTPHQLMRMNPNSARPYFYDFLRTENYEEVDVLHVESPSCIYVRRISDSNEATINKLRLEMSREYERNVLGFIHAPEKGMACAARGVNGHWYRAIICEVMPENMLKVFFVDLGYTMQQSYENVKALRENHMAIRVQAIKVSLCKIAPVAGQWRQEATEFISDTIKDSQETIRVVALEKIHDGFHSVMMLVNGNDSLSHLLVQNGYAVHKGPGKTKKSGSNKKHKKEEKKYENAMEVLTYDMDIKETIFSEQKESADPFKVCVIVHHVVSPDCIYVSDATCKQSNSALISEMQEFYTGFQCTSVHSWHNDAICAVYLEKDKAYHRAKILNIKSPEEVSVFCYDMGIEDTVPLTNVFPLNKKFAQISAYVFKVRLAGILPCGGSKTWMSYSTQKLKDMISENQHQKFYISKTEYSDDSAIPVDLWVKQAKTDGPLAPTRIEINSINRMLIEEGAALPIKDYAQKRDKILAVELQQQLNQRTQAAKQCGANVPCNGNSANLDACIDIDNNESIHSTAPESENTVSMENESSGGSVSSDIPAPLKISAWIPAEPILADRFLAIPTFVDYDCFIYLYSLEQNAETLKLIGETLEEKYINCKSNKNVTWNANDLCIAQYHLDKKWYRATVVQVKGNDLIDVQFADYGNIEECPRDALHKKIILQDIPIQTTKCIVHGLIPNNATGKWSEEYLDKLHALLVESECEVTVLGRQSDILVVSITLLPNSKVKARSDLVTHLITQQQFDVKRLCEEYAKDETINASSPSNSIDAPVDEYANTQEENNKSLNKTENSEESSESDRRKLSNTIIIGNSALIEHCSKGKEMEENGGGTDIENLSWSDVKEHVVSSTPHTPASQENLSAFNTIKIPENSGKIVMEIAYPLSKVQYYAQLKENTHCKELHEYYISYQRMKKQMQKEARNQPPIKNIVPNTPCCRRAKDKKWYRCNIEEVRQLDSDCTDQLSVRLFYVDFGNFDTINVDVTEPKLYSMKEEWLEVPMMALKCQLYKIKTNPIVENDKLVDKLQEVIDGRIRAEIKLIEGDLHHIEIYKKGSDVVAYNQLIEDGWFIITDKLNFGYENGDFRYL